MPDNLQYKEPTSGGKPVSTQETTINEETQHIQRVKIGLGATGAYQGDLETGQKAPGDSISVVLASDIAVPIDISSYISSGSGLPVVVINTPVDVNITGGSVDISNTPNVNIDNTPNFVLTDVNIPTQTNDLNVNITNTTVDVNLASQASDINVNVANTTELPVSVNNVPSVIIQGQDVFDLNVNLNAQSNDINVSVTNTPSVEITNVNIPAQSTDLNVNVTNNPLPIDITAQSMGDVGVSLNNDPVVRTRADFYDFTNGVTGTSSGNLFSSDVSGQTWWNSVAVSYGSAAGETIVFECSFDNGTWFAVYLENASDKTRVNTTNVDGLYYGPIPAPYFRITYNMTAGTINIGVRLSTLPFGF